VRSAQEANVRPTGKYDRYRKSRFPWPTYFGAAHGVAQGTKKAAQLPEPLF